MSNQGYWKCQNDLYNSKVWGKPLTYLKAYLYIRCRSIRQESGHYEFNEKAKVISSATGINIKHVSKYCKWIAENMLGATQVLAGCGNICMQYYDIADRSGVEKKPNVPDGFSPGAKSDSMVICNNKNTRVNIYTQFQEIWNQYAETYALAKIKSLTPSRKSKLKLRMPEGLSIEKFEEILKKLEKFKFYLGDNDRNWRIDFDFLIRNDTNWVKLAERYVEPEQSRDALFEGMTDEQKEYFKAKGW
jgi:hypothetical protein